MAKTRRRDRSKLQAAFHEVKHNRPAVVSETARKKGSEAAHKQEVAIALSKARRAGAAVPQKSRAKRLEGRQI